MENRWKTFEQRAAAAAAHGETVEKAGISAALAECVLGSHAIGSTPELVLHGGGNSSIKERTTDITGRTIDIIHVKGSGWDLATIEPQGFAPLRLERLRELLEIDAISDNDMVNELRCALLDASAPDPSVESLLHAMIPFRAVLHSHADSIVALTNQPNGAELVAETMGDSVMVVPYVMPGFDLAKLCAELWPTLAKENTRAMVLLNHGLFTFGDTMEEAYGTHIALITAAKERLKVVANQRERQEASAPLSATAIEIAHLRSAISAEAGRPMIVSRYASERVHDFVTSASFPAVATRGPATPDHIIRTKRLPLIGTDVATYAREYREYFERNSARAIAKAGAPIEILDPAPRFVLDSERGLFTVGKTAKDADIVRDIAMHTMDIIDAAEGIGSYTPLDEEDLFDVEYWDLEQAKLRLGGQPKPLAGQVAVITGAASGIGARCAERLLDLGASVVGIDIASGIETTFDSPAWLGIRADVTDRDAIAGALSAAVERFGGIDMVVVAAGVFAQSAPLTEVDRAVWDRTFSVNLNAVMTLFSQVHPYLVASPTDARVVLIGSKNVAAPGPGAAAYSSSKAAVTQLARVAALEWANDGIRVNTVHPDAVFDTGLWTDVLLEERAAKYGMTIDEYKRRNLLSTTVTTQNVAEMVAAMCTSVFASTTGAQVPVDGGNDRVV